MGATPAHPTLVRASFASWRVDSLNSWTVGSDDDGVAVVDLVGFDGSSVLVVSVLISSLVEAVAGTSVVVVVSSSTKLAKKRVPPPLLDDLSPSSWIAKSATLVLRLLLLVLYSCRSRDDDVCEDGMVNPQVDVMSNAAEADSSNAADGDDEDELMVLMLYIIVIYY